MTLPPTLKTSGPAATPDELEPATQSWSARLGQALALQRQALLAEGPPSAQVRIDRIGRLIEAIGSHADELHRALAVDYGQRNPVQSFATDIAPTLTALRHSQKRVRSWMKDTRSPAGRLVRAGGIKSRTLYQPLGVVGILSPWNFPVELSLHPLGQAFAAGNRAMLKLSEVTPATTAVLSRILGDSFDPSELVVVDGGPDVAAEFCRLPFDHIFFTGSTATGRRVAEAAAPNLVPVTLELGGQSPVVVAHDADLGAVASALIIGKTLNAGQFCVAPDHVYIPVEREALLVEALRDAARRRYPTGLGDDATAVIDERHFQRLQAHLSDARSNGATIVELMPVSAPSGRRLMAPTLILGAAMSMTVCQEEIFGPLLPIHTYSSVDEVIDRINAGPRPLAAYWFGPDSPARERFLQRTISGGVTLNDIMLHVGMEAMAFGGVGASGMGSYHGRAGFLTFSHAKGVVEVPGKSVTRFMHPPYPAAVLKWMHWHARFTASMARRKLSR
jgi:coniferyl-aldehyde dehydrogenase